MHTQMLPPSPSPAIPLTKCTSQGTQLELEESSISDEEIGTKGGVGGGETIMSSKTHCK